ARATSPSPPMAPVHFSGDADSRTQPRPGRQEPREKKPDPSGSGWMAIVRRGWLVEEPDQLLAPAGLLELPHGLRLDLANAFARHLEDVADFFQRVAVPIAQAIPQLDDLAFAVAQRLQHFINAAAEHFLRRSGRGALCRTVRQQVTEVAVLAVAHRPIKADRIAAHRQHAPRFFDRGLRPPSGLFERRFAAEFLK